MALMGADIRFDKTKCVVIKDDKEITIGHIFDDKLYRVNTDEYAHYSVLSSKPTSTWHCRYGHLNYDQAYVNKLLNEDLVACCWNSILDEYLISSGFHQSNADSCIIYLKSIKNSDGHISFVILAVYVDDIIPVSNDIVMLMQC